MKTSRLELIKESGIVAILRGIERKKILKATKALLDGGIKCIEVTFNTPGAEKMIHDIKKEFGSNVLVGAGTVTDEETAEIAHKAGAEFILSPSLHKEVIHYCKENQIISIPGAYTPTEIVMADKWGADIVKFFPAGAVDPKFIKLLSGPLDNIDLMAVGGIDLENVEDYIKNGCIGVGVGGSLVNKKHIENEEYDLTMDLAKAFIEKIKKARSV